MITRKSCKMKPAKPESFCVRFFATFIPYRFFSSLPNSPSSFTNHSVCDFKVVIVFTFMGIMFLSIILLDVLGIGSEYESKYITLK